VVQKVFWDARSQRTNETEVDDMELDKRIFDFTGNYTFFPSSRCKFCCVQMFGA
jgi:hypothetical protein